VHIGQASLGGPKQTIPGGWAPNWTGEGVSNEREDELHALNLVVATLWMIPLCAMQHNLLSFPTLPGGGRFRNAGESLSLVQFPIFGQAT
jgi:hypothetical protein